MIDVHNEFNFDSKRKLGNGTEAQPSVLREVKGMCTKLCSLSHPSITSNRRLTMLIIDGDERYGIQIKVSNSDLITSLLYISGKRSLGPNQFPHKEPKQHKLPFLMTHWPSNVVAHI